MVSTTNDADALAEQFGNLSTYTTPSPTSSLAFKYDRFADDDPPKPRPIPRYLFRVYSSHSAGKTSASIIQSKAACSNSPEIREMSRACIFSKRLRYLASDIAVKHLMRKLPNNEDNLISWTSSILFAIVYIFYHNIHYGAPRQDIHLCVIDTKRFRSKTFICDRDLMDVLKKDTDDWNSLVRWRRSTRLYFGEYLSQGSMNVVGKCVVVSAAQLFDEGLLDIHDRFPQLERQMQRERKTKLASIICDFRDNWPQNAVKLEQTRAEAIVKVADLFGRRWRLPVALSLVSLHHYSNVAWTLGTAFEEKSRHLGGLTEAELRSCTIATTVVVKHERLLEVNKLYENTEEMYSTFLQTSLKNAVVRARDFARESRQNDDISEGDYLEVKRRIEDIMGVLKINE